MKFQNDFWSEQLLGKVLEENVKEEIRKAMAVEDMAEYLPSNTSLEATILARQQRHLLQQAMANLRPEEYEVLYLKDVEERPYAEIAEQLNISLSAAKMRVQRARLALRVAYRQLAGEV